MNELRVREWEESDRQSLESWSADDPTLGWFEVECATAMAHKIVVEHPALGVVCVMGMSPIEPSVAVASIITAPSYRGYRRFLECARMGEKEARDRGVRHLVASVGIHDTRKARLFGRAGFVPAPVVLMIRPTTGETTSEG